MIKHAGRGGALIGCIAAGAVRGVAIAVWDRGPGMNVEACLRDGMSTAGTAGTGLGAVSVQLRAFAAIGPLANRAASTPRRDARCAEPCGAVSTRMTSRSSNPYAATKCPAKCTGFVKYSR